MVHRIFSTPNYHVSPTVYWDYPPSERNVPLDFLRGFPCPRAWIYPHAAAMQRHIVLADGFAVSGQGCSMVEMAWNSGSHFRWTTSPKPVGLSRCVAHRGSAYQRSLCRVNQRDPCLLLTFGPSLETFMASFAAQLMVEMSQIAAFTFGGLVHHYTSTGTPT